MYPVLFDIGPFVLRTYGVFLVAGFAAGIWLSARRAGSRGLDPATVYNVSIVILVAALIGSRLYYVLFHLDEFGGGAWWRAFVPLQPDGKIGLLGMSMFGGVLLSTAAALFYLRVRREPMLRFADVLAPGVMLGLGIARLGCHFNGCCFGIPTDGPFGVVFPHGCQAGFTFPGEHLIASQLISSAMGFAVFGLLLVAERRFRFRGSTFLLMLVLYGVGRFLVDFTRYYESETLVSIGGGTIAFNQLLVLATAVVAFAFWLVLWRRLSA
jgi:phosphatidylglycerol:prolipoprotein diacylglycerol transferase